jgi:hypothetical protein
LAFKTGRELIKPLADHITDMLEGRTELPALRASDHQHDETEGDSQRDQASG